MSKRAKSLDLNSKKHSFILRAMLETLKKVNGLYQATRGENPHGLAIMEGLTHCNRACIYCDVHNRENTEEASIVTDSRKQIYRVFKEGFRFFQDVGGETLGRSAAKGEVISKKYHKCEYGVPVCGYVESEEIEEKGLFRTKEGLTYADHATELIGYASSLGMMTNVITNGDFVELDTLQSLRKAGLDFINFSLHSPSESGIKSIIGKARAAAKEGLLPVVSLVFTSDRADTVIRVANTCAANGIFFSTSVVQEIGDGFSTKPVKNQVPSIEQIREVGPVLLERKRSGYVINNVPYLKRIVDFPDQSWKCNPDKDSFIHIRAIGEKGELGVCSEVRTGLDTEIDLNSAEWREKKRSLIENCPGCLYSCYFQAENSDFRGDFRTLINMALIKAGQAGLVRWLGRRSLERSADIVDVPESKIEKWQAELKDYNKLYNKAKRRGIDFLNIASTPFIYAVVFAAFGLMYLKARREGYNLRNVTDALNMKTVYPGFGDVDIEEEDESQDIDTSKMVPS